MFRLVLRMVAGMPVWEVSRGRGSGGWSRARAQRRSGAASAALLGVTGPSLVFAAVVADPNGGAQRPDMTTTANGTDLVNIVAPNAAGLSHNKFSEFSPLGRGVVLNNSVQPGESQIGGMAVRNPNLMQPATRALLEVTQQRSALQGTLEAFGGKLDVVVANQHGVTINGLTTLNVGRLGVTTGQVLPQADGTLRFGVTQGDVLIDHGGIDTKGLNMFDVVSRNIVVTGPISDSSGVGADVRLVAGMNTYDPRTGQYEATAPDGSKAPVLGISGGALGAMYGRHIVLASTESGVGVRHDRRIRSENDIRVSANGEVTLGGPLRAARQVTIAASQAGSSVSVQDVSADGAVIVSARGHVAINGAAAGADVVLLGDSVRAGQMSAQRDALVMAADEVKLNGPVNAQRDVLVDAQGDVAGSEWVKAGRNVQAGAAANPAGAVKVEDMQQLKAVGKPLVKPKPTAESIKAFQEKQGMLQRAVDRMATEGYFDETQSLQGDKINFSGSEPGSLLLPEEIPPRPQMRDDGYADLGVKPTTEYLKRLADFEEKARRAEHSAPNVELLHEVGAKAQAQSIQNRVRQEYDPSTVGGLVFRGAADSPEKIFHCGFTPTRQTLFGGDRLVVSTTIAPEVGYAFANRSGGYLYAAQLSEGGAHIRTTFNDGTPLKEVVSAYVKPSEIAFAIGPLLDGRMANGVEGLHLNPHSTVPTDAAVSMYRSLRKYVNSADTMDKNMSFKDRYESRRDYFTHKHESGIPDASRPQWKDSKDLKMLNEQLRTMSRIQNDDR
ncbi:filamentous hemagglutinin N-terminal domain-containing protein [Burkholderia ubonensis]|uniref:filamentous hemagglutinin N-terminal domain-containing protein n=1 Tax=Burkholderia ubonensis TaxID=101571 RepID=UPI001E56DC89|nr:filamentous hemagglutinin N-terminal domain-containing protein [Burkholderia ubonensis]